MGPFSAPVVGQFCGMGKHSAFFRLSDYPRLGVLVDLHTVERVARKRFAEELKRAKYLRRLDVPVPRYVGIRKVRFPEHFAKTLAKQDDDALLRKTNYYSRQFIPVLRKRMESWAGTKRDGLIVEHIEEDLTLVSVERLEHEFKKAKRLIVAKGIKPRDTHGPTSSHALWNLSGRKERSGQNILWSQRKQRFYFIDFAAWEIPGLPD